MARRSRSAFRAQSGPVNRGNDLGFRCARVQVSHARAESAKTSVNRPAEQGKSHSSGYVVLTDKESRSLNVPVNIIKLILSSDSEKLVLRKTIKPQWADAIGRDQFGLWAEIIFKNNQDEKIKQRLRWIPPGRFLMGSPENEVGRTDREGPQHEVELTKGYWLFDTPVTQALWQTIMDDNPSKFRSPARPIESVSWHDCTNFIEKINNLRLGLSLSLPSEIQWEYACQAGEPEPIYRGNLEILGDANTPVLNSIAWYGSSGEGFELN